MTFRRKTRAGERDLTITYYRWKEEPIRRMKSINKAENEPQKSLRVETYGSMFSNIFGKLSRTKKYILKTKNAKGHSLYHLSNCLQFSDSQPFWHLGLVSWKTIFPQMGEGGRGNGSGGNASDG